MSVRDSLLAWQRERTCHAMVEILGRRGYLPHFAQSAAEARRLALELIPEGALIGLGGSMTIDQLGLLDELRSPRYRLIDRYAAKDWEETMSRYREALQAELFLTGVNAITRAGELVFIDCSGNRVAASIFGPRKVLIIAGVNKVVENLDEAFARLRRIAPLNCRRLGHKTPCAESGRCEDCMGSARMCNYTGIIHHGFKETGRIEIILVAEDLGF